MVRLLFNIQAIHLASSDINVESQNLVINKNCVGEQIMSTNSYTKANALYRSFPRLRIVR